MRIDSTSALTSATSSVGGGLNATRDQFLKLFVAQLENQNPLDPQDGSDMVAQLAQFSSLEQQVEGNRRLDDLVAAQSAAASAGLADLAGRTITADLSTVTIDDNRTAIPPIELASTPSAHAGDVVIRNAAGDVIRRVPIEPGPPPTARWDGRDDRGSPVPRGSYSLEVEATASDGSKLNATPQIRARVDAVELGADGPRLRMGGVTIPPAAVRSILGPQGDAT